MPGAILFATVVVVVVAVVAVVAVVSVVVIAIVAVAAVVVVAIVAVVVGCLFLQQQNNTTSLNHPLPALHFFDVVATDHSEP